MFNDKIVLITGASSGIGRATAIKFAKKGANIIIIARDEKKLQQVNSELEKLNISSMICKCDVSDKLQVSKMYDDVIERFGGVDILVNNAGFAIYGSISNLTIDEIESQMATNYLGMVYCTKHFLSGMMQKNSGHIVNVASVAASFGLPGIASYCASKFAMLGFSEGLKHELKGTGVDVTVVSPIMVRTDFFKHPSFEGMPNSISLSADTVANAILKAANSSKLEIIIPSVVRGVVWGKHTFPFLVNPLMGHTFQKQLDKTKES